MRGDRNAQSRRSQFSHSFFCSKSLCDVEWRQWLEWAETEEEAGERNPDSGGGLKHVLRAGPGRCSRNGGGGGGR